MNSDINPKEMFEMYKERELIEDGNKAYKHVLGKELPHLFGMALLQPYLADALLSYTCKDKGEESSISISIPRSYTEVFNGAFPRFNGYTNIL